MWTGSDSLLSRRDLRVFVPEGLNDRSQAIYCLDCVQKATRPYGRYEPS
jgi:hypothetical protein